MTAPQAAPAKPTTTSAVQTSKTSTSSNHNRSTTKPQNGPSPQVQIVTQPKRNTVEKKIPRKSGKPFINWFQRKLAGSGKGKRTENRPLAGSKPSIARQNSAGSRQMGRITSSPLPIPAVQQLKQQNAATLPRRKTTRSISLNGDEELSNRHSYGFEDDFSDQYSLNRDSLWSPTSALEADDDASVRPLPPSAPPSPSPSRDSSSYLSDPRTFRSMAASTKPTTLLSIDLNGGMAHIAQVPPSATTPLHRLAPHVRHSSTLSSTGVLSSGTSITFSALPNNQPSSRPSSIRTPGSLSSINALQPPSGHSAVQAPLHTAHHPRNNPRPSSPPLDNASMLTLASSAFAMQRHGGPPSSALGDSVSHYGGSVVFPDGESGSQYVGDDERLDERDVDASVRALRPRSSRRGSWESEASRWSARVQTPGTTSLVRERSLWTTNSIRTGGVSTENGDLFETSDEQTPAMGTREIDSDRESLDAPVVDVQAATPQDEPSEDAVVGDALVEGTVNPELPPTASVQVEESPVLQHRSSTDTVGHSPIPTDLLPNEPVKVHADEEHSEGAIVQEKESLSLKASS